MTYAKGTDAPRRGWARMRELANLDKIEVAEMKERLLKALGRPTTLGEQIQAELIAVSLVKTRRLLAMGRDNAGERSELARLILGSPWCGQAAPETGAAPSGMGV